MLRRSRLLLVFVPGHTHLQATQSGHFHRHSHKLSRKDTIALPSNPRRRHKSNKQNIGKMPIISGRTFRDSECRSGMRSHGSRQAKMTRENRCAFMLRANSKRRMICGLIDLSVFGGARNSIKTKTKSKSRTVALGAFGSIREGIVSTSTLPFMALVYVDVLPHRRHFRLHSLWK